jgi:uncharacterized MAPEG superfamily protein
VENPVPLTYELTYLAWSVVLLIVHIALQGGLALTELGVPYGASPRDEGRQARSVYAGRADRALQNFLETYPAFVALVLALTLTGKSGGLVGAGAALWFWGRVAYVPLYLFGIPYARTAAWALALVGLLLMLAALLA